MKHCNMLQRVAVCCSVLQCVARSAVWDTAMCCSVLQCVAVCCSVLLDLLYETLQCVPACSIVLQCVAVCCYICCMKLLVELTYEARGDVSHKSCFHLWDTWKNIIYATCFHVSHKSALLMISLLKMTNDFIVKAALWDTWRNEILTHLLQWNH